MRSHLSSAFCSYPSARGLAPSLALSSAKPNTENQATGTALYEWQTWAIDAAQKNDVDPYEVTWLLQGVSSLSNTALRLGTFQIQPQISLKFSLGELTEKWQQRLRDRVPVQYLVGETPWRDLMLTVTPAVLIPRPETELVIDIVQQRIQESPLRDELEQGTWVDMGTGSGAIAISLARALPQAKILAVDISNDAITVAQQNAVRNGVAQHIEFLQGSWFKPLPRGLKLSGIVTNPPYIPTETVNTLDPEVHHEPRQALDGGEDGLYDIRALARSAMSYLRPGGLWITEHMLGQADNIAELLNALDYTQVKQHQDLSGIQRFVSGRCPTDV